VAAQYTALSFLLVGSTPTAAAKRFNFLAKLFFAHRGKIPPRAPIVLSLMPFLPRCPPLAQAVLVHQIRYRVFQNYYTGELTTDAHMANR
jgi:hypothetical protein